MHVKSVLDKKGVEVFSVAPDDTLVTVLKIFRQRKIGFAVVKSKAGGFLGTVSERDICHALAADESGQGLQTAVKEVMTENIVTCSWDDNLAKVMALMTSKKTRHVLVYDGEEVKGIISIGDVVKHRLDESLQDEVELRRYIAGTGYRYPY